MTDPASGRRLLIDADLRISGDGVDATVTGRGDELTVHTDQPVRLWRALQRSGLPGALRRLGREVDTADVVVPALTVEGPHGPIAGIDPVARRGDAAAPPSGVGEWVRPRNLVPPGVVWGLAAAGLLIALILGWSRLRAGHRPAGA